jgi:hypothetical protein
MGYEPITLPLRHLAADVNDFDCTYLTYSIVHSRGKPSPLYSEVFAPVSGRYRAPLCLSQLCGLLWLSAREGPLVVGSEASLGQPRPFARATDDRRNTPFSPAALPTDLLPDPRLRLR